MNRLILCVRLVVIGFLAFLAVHPVPTVSAAAEASAVGSGVAQAVARQTPADHPASAAPVALPRVITHEDVWLMKRVAAAWCFR
jgi:hypothetical protein